MTTMPSKPNCFYAEIVCEKTAISGLKDGCIYVLATRADVPIDSVKTAVRHYKNLKGGANALIYPYSVRPLQDISAVTAGDALCDAVQQAGANLILPISTPNVAEKQYLVSRSEVAFLDMSIPSMIEQAEEITKRAVEEALMNLAVQESASCNRLLGDVCLDDPSSGPNDKKASEAPSEKPKGNAIGGVLMRMMGAVLATPMAMMVPARGLYDSVPSDTSYKQSREIFGRFVENMKHIKRNEDKRTMSAAQEERLRKAKSEVDYVLNQFTPSIYSKFLLQMMKKNDIALAFDNCINREKIAANSHIKVSVGLPKAELDQQIDRKVVNKQKTNGKLRVYLSSGKNTVQVKFGRTAACVVYIMYLIDRKRRGDDIDTIKIAKNEKLFCELYGSIYDPSKAKTQFKAMITLYDNGNVKRSRLSDCYTDIRKALDEAASALGESALPFYIPNEYSHITVLEDKITLPSTFERLKFVY